MASLRSLTVIPTWLIAPSSGMIGTPRGLAYHGRDPRDQLAELCHGAARGKIPLALPLFRRRRRGSVLRRRPTRKVGQHSIGVDSFNVDRCTTPLLTTE